MLRLNSRFTRPPRILLVEDNDNDRYLTERAFAAVGCNLHLDCVEDGDECLRYLRKEREYSAALSPDLVLLDIGLPDLDGWSVLARLREISDVPVLMLTAAVRDEDKVRGLRAGADDYLPKPFELDELLARLRALLRRAKPEAEADEAVSGELLQVADLQQDPAGFEAYRTCSVSSL